VDLRSRRLCLTRLQVVSEIVDLKSITRTLPKRDHQFRYWHPKLKANPDLPKCKMEAIVIGATLDVAEEPLSQDHKDPFYPDSHEVYTVTLPTKCPRH
jgi:hypothetical protein